MQQKHRESANRRRSPALVRLHNRLRALSDTTDLLLELVGGGHFTEMAMTSDGLLVGRPRRCVGFDAFIGRPTPGMLERTARLWDELSADEQSLVLQCLAAQQIPPERVGINGASTTSTLVAAQETVP